MYNATEITHHLLRLAGLAQIMLALGSLTIPKILNWKVGLSTTDALIRQMFWVYAAYIFVINLSFGVVSFLASAQLADGSLLATALSGFIAVYWLSRLTIQFFVLDRANFPAGTWHKVGEVVLVTVFILLCITYSFTLFTNLRA